MKISDLKNLNLNYCSLFLGNMLFTITLLKIQIDPSPSDAAGFHRLSEI